MRSKAKLSKYFKKISSILEVLNTSIAYWFIFLLFLIAVVINYLGLGYENNYLLYKWNDNLIKDNYDIEIESDKITAKICGQIIANYTRMESELYTNIKSNIESSCNQEELSLRLSLLYALESGKLKLGKSYNKLIIIDELRGNEFVLKKKFFD